MKTVVIMVMVVMNLINGPFTKMGMKLDSIVTAVETKVDTVAEDIKAVTYVEKEFMGDGDEDEHYAVYRMSDGNYRIVYECKAFCHTDDFVWVEIADYDGSDIEYIELITINKAWHNDGFEYAESFGLVDSTMTKLALRR